MNFYFKPKCNKNASPIPVVQIPLYKQLPCDDEPDSSNYNSSTETNSSKNNSSETNTNISQLLSIHKYPVVCDDKQAESNKYTIVGS